MGCVTVCFFLTTPCEMNRATSRTFSRLKTIQQYLLTSTSSSKAVKNTFSGSLSSYQSNKMAPVELSCFSVYSCQPPKESVHGFMCTESGKSVGGKEPVLSRGEVSPPSISWLSSMQPRGLLASSAARAGSWSTWCTPGPPVPSLQPIHEQHSLPCNPWKASWQSSALSVGPAWK